MKPNTVVIGFPIQEGEEDEIKDDFVENEEYRSDVLDNVFPALEMEPKSAFKAEGFLAVVADVLKMQRSVCIHRNFQKLRHDDWFRKSSTLKAHGLKVQPCYIDVWLVDFFSAPNMNVDDICSLFVLQVKKCGCCAFPFNSIPYLLVLP